ncbi:MAG: hypothetical protein RLZZ216_349 [Cyanobacteriota bacterium]|jgi:hypothetical protein
MGQSERFTTRADTEVPGSLKVIKVIAVGR